MQPLVIVFVTPVFSEVREGPAIYARYLFDYFSGVDLVDFHVVTINAGNAGPNVHSAGVGKSSVDTYTRLQNHALKVCRQLNADIVHGNVAHAMWKFADYPGPVVLQVNDYDQAELWKNVIYFLRSGQFRRFMVLAWRRIKEKKALGKSRLVLCNSMYTKRTLLERYRIAEHKLRVVYKAVDLSLFRQPEELPKDPCPEAAGKLRLIFVGTNWRRKGLDVLLRAIREILGHRKDFILQVVGPRSEELSSELKSIVKAGGLEKYVSFEGPVDRTKLPAYLWHSDLFVLPSRDEALGVSILEALASGLPVIATRVGGIPEILEGQDCGVLVDAGNSQLLSSAILQLLDNKHQRSKMAQLAAACVERFSSEYMIREVESVYRELMND